MSAQACFRIMKELKEFHDHPDNNLYVNSPFSCFLVLPLMRDKVHYDEANVTKFNALLIGPEDTPYEYGMFEFLLNFPNGLNSRLTRLIFFGRLSFNFTI